MILQHPSGFGIIKKKLARGTKKRQIKIAHERNRRDSFKTN